MSEVIESHADLMDGVYRYQRHIYDITRKFYLLGRDRLVAGLDVPTGGTVLEIGCGTGRNLAMVARRYPGAKLFGIDISAEMLQTADANLARAGCADRVTLSRGDATDFDAKVHFGVESFDRVFISFALSMIPDWEGALRQAALVVKPGGSLHIVDFGRQENLPAWFKKALRLWLSRFHVTPRDALADFAGNLALGNGLSASTESMFGGYSNLLVLR